jgi:hypothetical protein
VRRRIHPGRHHRHPGGTGPRNDTGLVILRFDAIQIFSRDRSQIEVSSYSQGVTRERGVRLLPGPRRCRPGLQLDLDSVRGFGLAFGRRFGLGGGFAFTAGRVLRAGLPRSVVGGEAVHGLVRAGLQGVQAGRPVAGLVLRRECSGVRRPGYSGGVPGSGFGSGRYPSRCGRAMNAAASACVVSACAARWGGQG